MKYLFLACLFASLSSAGQKLVKGSDILISFNMKTVVLSRFNDPDLPFKYSVAYTDQQYNEIRVPESIVFTGKQELSLFAKSLLMEVDAGETEHVEGDGYSVAKFRWVGKKIMYGVTKDGRSYFKLSLNDLYALVNAIYKECEMPLVERK